MQRRFESSCVWLTVLVIAVGNALGLAGWLYEAEASRPACLCQQLTQAAEGRLPGGRPDHDGRSRGSEVAEHSDGPVLVANPSPQRQLIDSRLKAAVSPVLDEPQADRHMLLALARSAIANSTGRVPLLRSTHLRI